MSQSQIDILQRALKREKAARKAAENILEDKSRELFSLSKELKKTNTKLSDLLNEKTSQLQGVFDTFIDAYMVIIKSYRYYDFCRMLQILLRSFSSSS